MNAPLYTLDILRLAAETGLSPRLAEAGASAERHSKLCGSRITVDVAVDGEGRITGFGQDVRACALGQASATVLARHVKGKTISELTIARDALAAYLAGTTEDLPDWPDIAVLARARAYPARHAAIRLPFEAASDAAVQAIGRTR